MGTLRHPGDTGPSTPRCPVPWAPCCQRHSKSHQRSGSGCPEDTGMAPVPRRWAPSDVLSPTGLGPPEAPGRPPWGAPRPDAHDRGPPGLAVASQPPAPARDQRTKSPFTGAPAVTSTLGPPNGAPQALPPTLGPHSHECCSTPQFPMGSGWKIPAPGLYKFYGPLVTVSSGTFALPVVAPASPPLAAPRYRRPFAPEEGEAELL